MRNVCTFFTSTFKSYGTANSIKASLMVFVFILAIGSTSAQVSTTVTMSAVPIAGSPFASLADAVTAINALTITGPVVATSVAGSETAPAGTGYYITATGTITNTIIIQGTATTTITAGANSAAGVFDAVFKIVGGDYITIQNFTMNENTVANTVTTVGAANTMTEAGVLIIHASSTDGAQNNTIQNNIINLSVTYTNSVGVLSTSSSTTTNASPGGSTAADATSTAGTNSNNKIYGNTITNVQYGILFICPPITAAIFETGNDIGGSSAPTGNTITFGFAVASSGPWNRSQSTVQAGIYYRNGAGNSIRFNTVTSNSAAYVGSGGLNGIMISSGSSPTGVTYTSTISDNTVNLTTTGVALITGIDFGHGITTGTIVGSNNTLTVNQSATTTVSAAVIGIKSNYTAASSTLNTNNVTINQTFTAIATVTNSSPVTGMTVPSGTTGTPTMNILGNTITINRSTNVSSTFTATMSGTQIGIQSTTAATTMNVGTTGAGNNNTVTIKEAAGGGAGTTSYTSTITYIDVSATHATVNVVNNTLNTTGSTIRSSGTLIGVKPEATITVLANIKSNNFNVDRVATSGTVSFTTITSTPSEVADTISNNIITFTSLAGTTIATGISSGGGPTSPGVNNKRINNNTISISGTNTGTCIGITSSFTNTGEIKTNSITISCAAPTVTGITTSGTAMTLTGNSISLTSSTISPTAMSGIVASSTTGTMNINNNTVSSMNFSGVGGSGPTVLGINASGAGTNTININNNSISGISVGAGGSTGSPTVAAITTAGGVLNINKNTICSVSTLFNGASTLVSGIRIAGSTGTGTSTISNNRIGDLNASAAVTADGIRGINITSTATTHTYNVYYNTINISSATTAATFGSSGLFHTTSATATTATLDLRNNSISNTSALAGAGLTVAYRRSSASLVNYAATSNNNNFSASTIYTDGVTPLGLAAYKVLVTARDASSISVTPSFLSSTCGNANFLKINPAIASQIESGGANVGSITDDFENTIRQGNPGYLVQSNGGGTAPDIGADEYDGTPAVLCSGTPAASTITGAAAVCSNSGTTLSLSTVYTDLNITYQWASGTVSGGPYGTTLGTTATQATGNLTVPTYFICTITCTNSGMSFTTVEKEILINALPNVTVLPSSGTICNPGGSPVILTAGGGVSYAWNNTGTLTPTTGSPVSAAPTTTTTYTVTGTDGNGCTNTAMATVTVAGAVSISASATPSTICSGENSQLLASGLQSFTTPAPSAYDFSGSTGAYAAITGTTLSPGTTDDNGVGNLPIGFTFNYNGANHTVFGMRTNGLIELSQTTVALSGFSANALSSTANCIAPIWDDNNMAGGTMIYTTTGSVGSRILTAQWTAMHVGGSGSGSNPTINVQVKLYETSNKIEFIYGSTSAALSSTTASIGISGASGNYLSVTPLSPVNTSTVSSVSENTTISSATNFPSGTVYTFTPTGAPVFSYSWSPATFLSATNISNPLATAVTSSQTYTVTVTGNGGCSNTASVNVNVSSGASITAEPVSDTKCVGQTATFTVAATGPSLTYQWRKGGIDIPIGGNASAGTSTLSLTNVMAGDAAVYDVIVTSTCGSPVMSNGTSTLVVNTLPTVTVSPSTGTICNPGGSPITLTAGGGVSYAWNNTGSLTPTSGSPVSAAPFSTTTYIVTGTDSNGCTNTAMATVTVADAVSATASATPTLVCSGGNSQLDAIAIQGGGQSVIGAGASTSSSTAQSFFPGSWGGAKTQYIVLGSELIAQGLKAGNITALAFEPTTAGQTYQGFFVSIGTTAQTAMTTSFITTGLTEVYAGTLANNGLLPVANSVNTLTFGTGGTSPSFNWNGSSNIVISISWSSVPNASTSTSSTMKVDAPGFTCSAYDQQDNVSPATMKASTTADGTGTSRPKFTFTGNKLVASPTYTWSESPAGSTLSSTNIVNPMANGISGSTTYSVTVTGNGGCSNTASVTVEVSSGASITSEPVSDSKCVGQTATFTVGATGPSLTYQWRKGGVDIPIGGNASAGTLTLTLTNVMAGDAGLYDVIVTSTCGSPVMSNGTSTLTVNAIPTASATNDGPKCVGSDLNLTGTHSGGSLFAWTGPASYTANTQNASRSPLTLAHSGTYTFTATSAEGCTSDPATTNVTVNATPSAISIAPAGPLVLCSTSPAELLTSSGGSLSEAIILTENFNSGISGWTNTNSSTGGTPANAIWTLRPDAYVYSTYGTWHSNDNSQFVLTNSDSQGSGGTTATNLRSPSFNTVDFTSASVTFYHYFNEPTSGSSTGKVEASTDGIAWTTLQTYNSTTGAVGTFASANIVLTAPFLNQPTVYIRFKYDGIWRYFWGIDNVIISGTKTIPITWSPTSGLFTDAAATMAYTGTPTTMVYAKPVATETYTVISSTAAQFTLDGNMNESGWGAALATSAGGPTPGFSAGHEINALYIQANHSDINFGIAGNVQDGNRILLFIDSKSGGYNDGSFGRTGAPQGIDDFNSGTTFDAGFNADYCLVIGTNLGSTNYFFDLYTLSAGGGPATYLGDVADPKIGADPLNASNTRGFEIAILKTLLGYTGGTVKVFAMYTSDGGFLSNQFLTIAGNADGNYGSGAVTFGSAMPDPVTVPLTNLQNYCISTGTVTVGIEGTLVKNTGNAGLNTLRSVYSCIAEGGTITYDQPATVTTVLTAPLDFTKSVTIQGLDSSNRPEITLTAAGSAISTGKTLTLRNVDIKSPGTTFTGDGNVNIDTNATTVIKQ